MGKVIPFMLGKTKRLGAVRKTEITVVNRANTIELTCMKCPVRHECKDGAPGLDCPKPAA